MFDDQNFRICSFLAVSRNPLNDKFIHCDGSQFHMIHEYAFIIDGIAMTIPVMFTYFLINNLLTSYTIMEWHINHPGLVCHDSLLPQLQCEKRTCTVGEARPCKLIPWYPIAHQSGRVMFFCCWTSDLGHIFVITARYAVSLYFI